jgi:hypothetical protein
MPTDAGSYSRKRESSTTGLQQLPKHVRDKAQVSSLTAAFNTKI